MESDCVLHRMPRQGASLGKKQLRRMYVFNVLPVSRIIERVTSFVSMLRHLGGVGVFILAALDSSVLPTLGAVDALTIVLAARHPRAMALLRHV